MTTEGTLTHSSSGWTGGTSQTNTSSAYTFSTGGKYNDQNIEFTINIPYVVLPNSTSNFKVYNASENSYIEISTDSSGNITLSGGSVS